MKKRMKGSEASRRHAETPTTSEVTELAAKVLGRKMEAASWMQTPQRALGEQIPIELCRTARGRQKVRAVLGAINDGGYL
jgi:uncharacterized protein (DUF2384 family)